MSQEEIRNQQTPFQEAMNSVANEINEDMLSWDMPRMLNELRKAIFLVYPKQFGRSHNSIRAFSRNCLGMRGNQFNNLRAWLNGRPMLVSEIQLVLLTLNGIANGTLKVEKLQEIPPQNLGEISEQESFNEVSSSGAARKLIDHTITISNSLAGLVIEMGVKPSDVYDGDRMQICDALKHICRAFGIKATFPEPDMARSEPLTNNDLRDLGLRTSKGRRKL